MRKWMKAREGTFKFIKIKKFIRGNSEWRVYTGVPRPAFPIFEKKRRNSDGSRGKGKVEKIASRSTFPSFPFPWNRPKRYYNYFTRNWDY